MSIRTGRRFDRANAGLATVLAAASACGAGVMEGQSDGGGADGATVGSGGRSGSGGGGSSTSSGGRSSGSGGSAGNAGTSGSSGGSAANTGGPGGSNAGGGSAPGCEGLTLPATTGYGAPSPFTTMTVNGTELPVASITGVPL